MVAQVSIRPLSTLDEIKPIEQLQAAIWGYGTKAGPPYPYPGRCLFEFVESGGHVGGAYSERDELIGFSAAWIGREKPSGRLYLHSQLMGVLEAYRDQGIGQRLKLQQREFARSNGLTLIKWTFDPLRPRNAHVNLTRLGAIVRHFVPNYYGLLGGTMNTDRPTDRVWAEWYVDTEHVQRRLDSAGPHTGSQAGEPINRIRMHNDRWTLSEFALKLTVSTLLLELPSNLDEMAVSDAESVRQFIRALQLSLREVFAHYLPAYTITDCHRVGDRVVYVFRKGIDWQMS